MSMAFSYLGIAEGHMTTENNDKENFSVPIYTEMLTK